jgi:hypothetical protein
MEFGDTAGWKPALRTANASLRPAVCDLSGLVQLDGSDHDWFEGRRGKCVLMVMVDDATNRVWAQFFEAETTRASYELFAGWVRRWGLPGGLYVDRDSIYRCEGLGSVAEQLAGAGPQTQFGRACRGASKTGGVVELAKQESSWPRHPSFRWASEAMPVEKMGGAAKKIPVLLTPQLLLFCSPRDSEKCRCSVKPVRAIDIAPLS